MLWTIFAGGSVGILLGFVLQRTRFCMTGGFRDMYLNKNNKMFYAFLIAIAVQSLGVLGLVQAGYIPLSYKEFSLVAVIFGSFLFGIGIILASGCATGTWYRAGEGLIGSWIALAMYMLFSSIMKYGALNNFQQSIEQYGRVNENLAGSLGVSVWWLVALLLIATAYGAYRTWLKRPKIAMASLPAKHSGLRHWLFEKRYHPFSAAIIIGLLAILAWVTSTSTGRVGGLGISLQEVRSVRFFTAK